MLLLGATPQPFCTELCLRDGSSPWPRARVRVASPFPGCVSVGAGQAVPVPRSFPARRVRSRASPGSPWGCRGGCVAGGGGQPVRAKSALVRPMHAHPAPSQPVHGHQHGSNEHLLHVLIPRMTLGDGERATHHLHRQHPPPPPQPQRSVVTPFSQIPGAGGSQPNRIGGQPALPDPGQESGAGMLWGSGPSPGEELGMYGPLSPCKSMCLFVALLGFEACEQGETIRRIVPFEQHLTGPGRERPVCAEDGRGGRDRDGRTGSRKDSGTPRPGMASVCLDEGLEGWGVLGAGGGDVGAGRGGVLPSGTQTAWKNSPGRCKPPAPPLLTDY